MPFCACLTSGEMVSTTMPSATGTVQAVWILFIFSMRTRHIRQAPAGRRRGWWQKYGMSAPAWNAAVITSVPFGTETGLPSMLRLTISTGGFSWVFPCAGPMVTLGVSAIHYSYAN